MTSWRARNWAWAGAGLMLSLFLATLSCLVVQVSEEVRVASRQKDVLARSAGHSLGQLNAAIAELRGAIAEANKAQKAYYWDLQASIESAAVASKNSAELLRHLDEKLPVVLGNMDGRAEELTKRAGNTLENADHLLQTATGAVESNAFLLHQNLQASRASLERLEKLTLALQPSLLKSAESAAHSAQMVDESATAIRDMLSPKKKSFWRRVLGLGR